MQTIPLELEPTSILEWDAEDEVAGVLAGELEKASNEEAREMLKHMQLDLPKDIIWTELHEYAEHRKTPLELVIPPDSKHYAFYQIELPLNILVTGKQRVVRLNLNLDLGAREKRPEQQILAYDLFPTDQSDLKTIMTGEANLDVSKALKYILTMTGAGTVVAPLAECFGFKLALPFKWTSMHARVRTSDRMSNPVIWHVTDESIQNGFTGHIIIRAPKRSIVNITATLACELRKAGLLGRILKAQYVSKSRVFTLKED